MISPSQDNQEEDARQHHKDVEREGEEAEDDAEGEVTPSEAVFAQDDFSADAYCLFVEGEEGLVDTLRVWTGRRLEWWSVGHLVCVLGVGDQMKANTLRRARYISIRCAL